MTNRKLSIAFTPEGDVRYEFWSSGPRPLTSYLIEHPASRVVLLEGSDLDLAHHGVTARGFMRLTWDAGVRRPSPGTVADCRYTAALAYCKQGKLEALQTTPPLWRYRERIPVKATFGLWLGGSGGALSAVRAASTATFLPRSGAPATFKPRQLAEKVFHEDGVLVVDWQLEPNP